MPMRVKESAEVQAAKRQAKADIREGLANLGIVLLLIVALIAAVGVNASIFYSVYAWLKEPMPGEGGLWSTAGLAFAGMVVVLGFHTHSKHNPDGPLLRSVEVMTGLLAILYGLGAGGALAAGLWFGGTDLLFGADGGSVGARIGAFAGHVVQQAPPGAFQATLEQTIFPALSVAFVLGAGGLPIVVFYLSHKLLDAIEAKGPAMAALLDAIGLVRIARKIERLEKRDAALRPRHEALRRVLDNAPAETARLVLLRVATAIRIAESWAGAARLELEPGPVRVPREAQGRPHAEVNLPELERRIERMRAYRQADVFAALNTREGE